MEIARAGAEKIDLPTEHARYPSFGDIEEQCAPEYDELLNTLHEDELFQPVDLERQEALVRKLVAELAPFDNVFYEIQNEPWADHGQPAGVLNFSIMPQDMAGGAGGFWKNRVDLAAPVSLAWQEQIAKAIASDALRTVA